MTPEHWTQDAAPIGRHFAGGGSLAMLVHGFPSTPGRGFDQLESVRPGERIAPRGVST